MSLINQMLQDLEQRKADGGAAAAQVRAVHRPGSAVFVRWIWVLVILLAVVVGGAYWVLFKTPAEKRAQPAPLAATANLPAAAVPEPVSRPGNTPSVLQLASELSLLPSMPASAPKAERASSAAASLAVAEELPPPVAEKPQPAAAEIKKPAGTVESPPPAGINKEIRQPTPQQRAENAYRQAYASLQQGRMGEAEESLRQALQLEPRHAAARQALAALLLESRRLDRAEQLLQQGLELQPGNAGYAMTLARIQVERGDVPAALATLQRNPPAGENA
ncbi:MAG: hypothetical protein C3F18_09585, partial [Nitrosomonadales bacterium]